MVFVWFSEDFGILCFGKYICFGHTLTEKFKNEKDVSEKKMEEVMAKKGKVEKSTMLEAFKLMSTAKALTELYEENNELPNIFDDILSNKTHKQPQYRLKRKQVGNSKLSSLSNNFGLNH